MARRKLASIGDVAGEIAVNMELITPDQAEKYLANRHENQRPLNRNVTKRYLAEMRSGNWKLSPHGIVIDSDGKLIDGQHRMEALRIHGKPLPFLVFRCNDGEVMWAIDRGKSRTMANLMEMTGRVEKGNGAAVSSICKALYAFQTGDPQAKEFSAVADKILQANQRDIEEVLGIFGKKSKTPASVFAGFTYAYQAYPDNVSTFLRRVRNNDALEKGTGEWHMRSILDDKSKNRNAVDFLDITHRTLHCICMSIAGRKTERIRILGYKELGSLLSASYIKTLLPARAARGLHLEVF